MKHNLISINRNSASTSVFSTLISKTPLPVRPSSTSIATLGICSPSPVSAPICRSMRPTSPYH